MAIESSHLRLHIVRPVLQYLDSQIPYSMAAENLLLGTCATESHMGTYLVQLNGPAEGIFQMEPATEQDIRDNYLQYRPELRQLVESLMDNSVMGQLVANNNYATAMARIHYVRVPDSLPQENDIPAMANYWKAYYNTPLGSGTVGKFIQDYERFV